MAITQTPSQLFTTGRACSGPLAVVLHEAQSGLSMLDQAMDFCFRRKPAQSPGCHTSYHYGVDGCIVHQYVNLADTAWGFGVTSPTCPAPICPPDPCASCTGLTVDQYETDLAGNPPVLPSFVAGPDGTVNCAVIHVALATGVPTGTCCNFLTDPQTYNCYVKSLAQIFIASGLTPSQTTLLVHCGELPCLDIDQLVIDILAVINAPPAPPIPCSCTPSTAQLCASLATVPTGAPAVAGTLVLGSDCTYHALPNSLTPLTVSDTATVDLTLVANNLSAAVVVSPDAGNGLVAHANGLFVPADVPFIDCGGVAVSDGASIITKADIAGETTLGAVPVGGQVLVIDPATGCPIQLAVPFSCNGFVQGVLGVEEGSNPPQLIWGAPRRQQYYIAQPGQSPSIPSSAAANPNPHTGGINSVYLVNSNVDADVLLNSLTGTSTSCAEFNDIWIKNIGPGPVTITPQTVGPLATTIDGSPNPITLDGQVVGGYPFGNNGGESVHLMFDDVNQTYWVV